MAPRPGSVASAALRGHCKMAIVVRTDLGMGKGKMCAQSAHAALAAYRSALEGSRHHKQCLAAWELLGQTKVVVKAGSEEELLALHGRARAAGLIAEVIRDAGHTQVAAGSHTVLAIGPDEDSAVDAITGHLKLL